MKRLSSRPAEPSRKGWKQQPRCQPAGNRANMNQRETSSIGIWPRTILAAGLGLSAVAPFGTAWAHGGQHAAANIEATTAVAASRSRTFWGLTDRTRYGQIQVGIVVRSRRIRSVRVANTPDSARGTILQGDAIPVLKRETLKVQSAGVHVYSGATQTSEGYISSLRSAIGKARKAKSL